MFKPARREQSRLRMTIDGPAGSGKTYTALRIAHTITRYMGGKIAVIDTERGSASKYVGEAPDGYPWEFDVAELTSFSPDRYTELIQLAGRLGYAVLVIDSFSHAWAGMGGALEIKERLSGDSWRGWGDVTPLITRMIDTLMLSPCHIITTMRSKMEYVQEEENGRIVVRRIGMAPIQRPGMEYEFDIIMDIDWGHIATVSKGRCPSLEGLKVEKPGEEFALKIVEWLRMGKPRLDLNTLVQQYGAEAILAANEGRIPTTNEELYALAQKLEGK